MINRHIDNSVQLALTDPSVGVMGRLKKGNKYGLVRMRLISSHIPAIALLSGVSAGIPA